MIALSYLIGAIPPSYLIGKYVYGIDIRQKGSGNVGGANAARTMGLKVGLAAGLFDILKGTLAVFLTKLVVNSVSIENDLLGNPNYAIVLSAFAVIVGHCYSFLLEFKGGKGGATTAGVMLILDPFIFFLLITTWILIVATTRFTSLGNLVSVFVIPTSLFYRGNSISKRFTDFDSRLPYVLFGFTITIFIFYTHRTNLVRLLGGYGRKVGDKE